MVYALLFVAELITLSFLSRILIQRMYESVFLVTRSRSVSVSFVTITLFFGTVVHELSHMFVAEIMGVRTGRLELAPDSIRNKEIHAGSIAIAQSDPIRRSIIGLAPLFVGITVLTLLCWLLPEWLSEAVRSFQDGQYVTIPTIRLLASIFAIFAVSNTMFSSPEDLKGVPAVLITIAIIICIFYITGIRIAFTGSVLSAAYSIGQTLTTSLGIVLAVNSICLLMLNFLLAVTGKMVKRRIVNR